MDIKELKLNNLIKHKIANGFAVYQIVDIDGINQKVLLSKKDTKKWVKVDMILPIPLKDKLLLKSGFEKMSIDDFEFPDGEELEALYLLVTVGVGELWIGVQKGIFFFCTENNNYICCDLAIRGVHSLQNRYYSMFEMELKMTNI